MITRNSLRFLMGGAAVLSLALVSTVPVSAEIAKRNVYRDASTTTVDAGSTEEFARLYNAGQAKLAEEGSAVKEFSGSPELSMGSKEFQRIMASNELQGRLNQSNELQGRLNQSNELQGRLNQSNELQGRLYQSNELQGRLNQSNELQGRLNQSNELQGRLNQSNELQGRLNQSNELQNRLNQ